MKPISHQTAHSFLHLAADGSLGPEQKGELDFHLAGCGDCRDHARRLAELESGLRRVARQQWTQREPELSLPDIKQRLPGLIVQNRIGGAISRFAVIPVLALAFVMAVRMVMPQQLAVNLAVSGTPQFSVHTPTPSSRPAPTKSVDQACASLDYVVQAGDTLDSIAARFDIPREAIRQYNALVSDQLPAGSRLAIPVCDQGLADTTTTPTVTLTIIPQSDLLSPSPTG